MSLTYASAIAQIRTHAAAAGAALDNPILDVDIGAPVPTSGRCVRIFYGGESEPVRMGGQRVLSGEMVGENIEVILWLSVSDLSQQDIAAVETELYAFKAELRTRILGDSQLGGNATDLEMSYAVPDYVAVANTRYRTLETTITVDFVEATISA